MSVNTEYRRDLQHTWMILSGGMAPEAEAYPVRMLTENRICGLLSCRTVSLDGKVLFYYDISSRHSLASLLETEQIGKDFLTCLLTSLVKLLESLEEFLLDADGLMLDPRYLYCDPEFSGICFCWYPGNDTSFRDQAKILSTALLPQLDQSDRTAVVVGYRFYQYCEAEELTKERLRELLMQHPVQPEMRLRTREEAERAAVLDSFFDDTEEETSAAESFGNRIRNWFSRRKKKKDDHEEQTLPEETYAVPSVRTFPDRPESCSVVGEKEGVCHASRKDSPEGVTEGEAYRGAETTLLTPEMLFSGQRVQSWSLQIKERSGEEYVFPLNEDLYLVGKKETGATLPLASQAVSRLHARLQKAGEDWRLTDLNSRNGTVCVRTDRSSGRQQEMQLKPEETILLQEGDEIRFADVCCRIMYTELNS